MREPILVTGGTGTLGRVVVRELLDAGRDVRVLSRRSSPEQSLFERVTGDLRRGTGVDAAVSGVAAIVHCATTLGRADVATARTLVDAARRHGNPHIVYISIVGVDRVPLPYYRAKLEVERMLTVSGLPWTILRTTQFHDLIARIASLQARSPVNLTLGGAAFQPVDVGEVAVRLAELAVGEPAGRVPDMGGPEIRSHRDLTREYLRATGRRRLVLPVRVPGAISAAYRRGGHLAPERAVGRVTFADYLAART
ncbi:uncharacterized protein YbjT (DUF2867 family) [Saccharopolyspora erythraea NRRL 2338]|uniref:NAD(P)-binding domain-containing protein n=2 Tax=Saccharopolyspora erythraea TaxID=1836 RepID=A4FAL1_SACEN|nr:NAD(P)H-binding protein [Saccharopolyspora erythraea]EQD84352.1 nucleotide-diphosphate-sugar epimerase [Saccharopolyspora erythraea D]PFG94871.1 uncharacterized protein YbjT (DUF2867 family) [Saccharopolyspora erythraea NRRL 2338]QRK91573.1 NAD(P)H-binding protein [Saccharopolyspora erythraea]CAM01086.1 hypothetical protein SACE_1769 [Saccharopolyspora erythraea NRRL 2338]